MYEGSGVAAQCGSLIAMIAMILESPWAIRLTAIRLIAWAIRLSAMILESPWAAATGIAIATLKPGFEPHEAAAHSRVARAARKSP